MTSPPGDHGNVSVAEFTNNLAESGLLDLADLLPESGQFQSPDGASAARNLVETGKLTGYQADAVLGRRFSDLRIGNYEILDKLGAGGMGTVFKARHRRMKRIVALKVLSREVAKSGSFADRFQREVETIARLSHPNIVMAFDADEDEAGPFLVMEFVDGRDLASEVAQVGPLSVTDAIDCILQSARGLEYAHGQGIVHRDIKPGNLLRDRDGVVKVADLGLARLNAPEGGASANLSITQAGMVVGTAEYMSPEQAIDSGHVDHRADIYSLGCTLYFLLVGRAPYQAGSIMAMLLKHREAPIPALRESRSDVTAEVDSIFRRMVAKAPEDRYPTMNAVVSELQRVQSRSGPARAGGGTQVPKSAEPTEPLATTGVFEATPGEQGGPTSRQEGSVTGLSVVLVEPSRTQAGIIRRYLQQLGAGPVQVTGSGQEALELVQRERVGVVVSSMHLSDMSGVELARALLADKRCAGAGFVLATSEADTQELGSMPKDRRVVVMQKPFDLDRLARSIVAVVG